MTCQNHQNRWRNSSIFADNTTAYTPGNNITTTTGSLSRDITAASSWCLGYAVWCRKKWTLSAQPCSSSHGCSSTTGSCSTVTTVCASRDQSIDAVKVTFAITSIYSFQLWEAVQCLWVYFTTVTPTECRVSDTPAECRVSDTPAECPVSVTPAQCHAFFASVGHASGDDSIQLGAST